MPPAHVLHQFSFHHKPQLQDEHEELHMPSSTCGHVPVPYGLGGCAALECRVECHAKYFMLGSDLGV